MPHLSTIDPDIRQRFTALKGDKEFAFEAVRGARTAHLVIDMQNGFVEEGAVLEVPVAREIIANINVISTAVREAGGPVLFFRFTTDETSSWPVYLERFSRPDRGLALTESFRPGQHSHQLNDRLEIEEHDLVVDKTRFSAFVEGSSNALALLREQQIDTVVISGTLSNCCCESTARDAQQLGFNVIFVDDANAALSDLEHNATLNNLAGLFADIRSTADVVTLLASSAR